jgi:hypothetical protein
VRRVLVVLVCVGLSLVGGPVAAEAVPVAAGVAGVAAAGQRPSAPRSVVADGLDGRGVPRRAIAVSWRRPASVGSSKIRSYVVRVEPGVGRRASSRVVVGASKRSVTVRDLTPGRGYRVTVRAVNRAGRGRAAVVRYTLPRHGSWVFAVDTARSRVVRVPVVGGPARVVARSGTAWAVNAAGDVYVVDQAAKTVTRVPVNGSKPSRVGSGFRDPSDVQLDGAGRVYVVDGTRVVRMSATGKDQRVVAQPVSPAVFVRADGTVSTTAGDAEATPLQLVTFPAGGGTPVKRTLEGQNQYGEFYAYRQSLIGDSAGNLFLHWQTGGGSGFEYWFRVAAGSTAPTFLLTRDAYYAVAIDPNSRFYLAQTATFCDSISVSEGTCTPDETVSELLRYAPDGTSTTIKITPFSYDQTEGPAPVSALAADRQGRVFVAQAFGPSAGLLTYGPTGGAPTVLASGTFKQAKRNN